jgi:uncharacterized membrane protein
MTTLRCRWIAAAALALAVGGCQAQPAADAPPAAGAPVAPAAPGTAVAGRAEWDSDRARAIWADARARGATFRAIGQEPGWHLELFEGERIVFVTDYGDREVTAPWPAPEVGAQSERVVLRAATGSHTLVVTLWREACQDSMSGEPFEFTVTVTLDGTEHRGCGRRLE